MQISSTGALAALSYEKTGRSPKDKRIVEEASSKDKVWWGDINIPLSEESFAINRQAAVDFLNSSGSVPFRVIVFRHHHSLLLLFILPEEFMDLVLCV